VSDDATAGALAGVRVLDLSQFAPGLFAGRMLADLGAEVVSVEAPVRGRAGSHLGELPLHGGQASRRAGTNPFYRRRRSVVVDLKDPAGRDVVLAMADRADVFLEGFRPGVCDRLGVGHRDVSARNPGIVYCSLTGYGQQGPSAQKPGHDLTYLAESGLLATTARDGQRPGIPLNLVADLAGGGLMAALRIVAALRARDATGTGTYLDVAMVDGVRTMLAPVAAWMDAGVPDPSWGGGLLSGAAPHYDCYRTADGKWISVAALEPKFFAALCEAVGRPDLRGLDADTASWGRVREALEEAFGSRTLAQWLQRCADLDVPVAPVRSMGEVFADPDPGPGRDEQVAARPGSHTREVLGQAGFAPSEIDGLLRAGVVQEAS
jgi:alpha-methylacyl-CoA racemase